MPLQELITSYANAVNALHADLFLNPKFHPKWDLLFFSVTAKHLDSASCFSSVPCFSSVAIKLRYRNRRSFKNSVDLSSL